MYTRNELNIKYWDPIGSFRNQLHVCNFILCDDHYDTVERFSLICRYMINQPW